MPLYGKVIVPAVAMAAVGADTDGVELHIGDRVRDEMFGLGTVKGNVACVGGGCNLLVDWDEPMLKE